MFVLRQLALHVLKFAGEIYYDFAEWVLYFLRVRDYDALAIPEHDMAGYPDNGGIVRNIPKHYRSRADSRVLADDDVPQNLGPATDNHPIADCRVAFALVQAGATKGDALIDSDVVANLGRLADYHSHAVIDEKPAADAGSRMYFNAGEKTRNLR